MMNDNCIEAKAYWTISIQYLHLVGSVATETIKQGNSWVIITDHTPSLDDFQRSMRWADHNLIIPLLFNLYHGFEVILKGFLLAADVTLKKNHKLSQLLLQFEGKYIGNSLSPYVRKYIHQNELPPLLTSFCRQNCLAIDEYYQALKYPESSTGKKYQHTTLQYRGEQGLPFFQNLTEDIDSVRKETVSLGRTICQSV